MDSKLLLKSMLKWQTASFSSSAMSSHANDDFLELSKYLLTRKFAMEGK
jgi:hypothetical protein